MASDTARPACPVPLHRHDRVLMSHGGGGRMTHDLCESVFLPAFANAGLEQRHDGAVLAWPGLSGSGGRLAFSTDSYVVRPLFFPGGDIGSLAVNGTVNDLAMCGATPVALSAALIIEEGLPIRQLERIAASMARAARAAGVPIVTGDTKVVEKGKGDGVFVNTAGVGIVSHDQVVAPSSLRAGDLVLLSGDIGRHGITILSARESLGFDTGLESDCAPLVAPVRALLDAGIAVHCLRDLTRGGLGAALVEIAEASRTRIRIEENAVPVCDAVAAACELLGLDPLHVANEGRFVAFVAPEDADRAAALLQAHPVSSATRVIGVVEGAGDGLVTVTTRLGASRIVDLPSGEQLPRIC